MVYSYETTVMGAGDSTKEEHSSRLYNALGSSHTTKKKRGGRERRKEGERGEREGGQKEERRCRKET